MYPAIVNSPQTELSAAIDATQNTVPVTDATKLPAAPNLATIGGDETAETIRYTAISGNTLTGVTRGFQGTARAWAIGSKVARNLTAYDIDTVRTNIADHETRVAAVESGKAPIASPAFTGTVILPGDPASALQAATKQYVDNRASAYNYVINGNADVWNEGYSFDTNGSRYTAEMWRTVSAGATYTVSRQAVTDLPGSEYCYRIAYKTAGANDFYFCQGFTRDVFNKLKGKTVVVSFKARRSANAPSVFTPNLKKTATETNTHGGTVIGASAIAGQLTTSWADYSFVVAMPNTSDANLGLQLVFQCILSNVNDYVEFAQIAMYVSNVAQPYQPRSEAEEFALTLPFWEKSYDKSVAPGAVSSFAGAGAYPAYQANGTGRMFVGFKAAKRVSPTVNSYSPSTGLIGKMYRTAADINSALTDGGQSGFAIYPSGTYVVGDDIRFHWVADARL